MNCNGSSNSSGPKRYNILTRTSDGWWNKVDALWAANGREAAETYIENIGLNPPNEIAVQSTTGSSAGVFKLYRVKPRRSFNLEVI